MFALVDEVTAAIDAPVPPIVGVDGSLDAYSTSVGLRRRRMERIDAELARDFERVRRIVSWSG